MTESSGAPAPAPGAPRDDVSSPRRTCVGCRRTGHRSVLLRFVAVQVEGRATLVPDPRRSEPGRGAWVHPDPECGELAGRRQAFTRALRVAGPLDVQPLLELLHEYALATDPGREHPTSPSPSAPTRATGSGSER